MERNKKNVLYISNIEVPYRTSFFNQLSNFCELTVLYERKKSKNRNNEWTQSISSNYKKIFLKGIKVKKEFGFDLKIFKYLFNSKFDKIIFGCYNSYIEMLGILVMRLFKKKYYINIDGEYFLEDGGLKGHIKRSLLKGATGYFVAGKLVSENIKKILKTKNVYQYNFSSLTEKEIKNNGEAKSRGERKNYILVVGQYENYKGLDIAIQVAKKMPDYKFIFVGMNKKINQFNELVKKLEIKNIESIPFVQKYELYRMYQDCKCLLLPSRRECWGLVVNEAISFGTPIVSNVNVGSIKEIFNDYKNKYNYILYDNICEKRYIQILKKVIHSDNIEVSSYLLNKAIQFSIEENVKSFLELLNRGD